MSILLIIFLLFLSNTGFTNEFSEYYIYYNGLIQVYKSVYPVEPFFEYTKVVKYIWKRPEAKLRKIREVVSSDFPLILVHGIDPNEINGEWTIYKNLFVEAWNSNLPPNYELYLFLYPTLDVPLEDTAKIFVKEVLSIGKQVNVYAHSMGGLLLRHALQDERLRMQINKMIFAGTPHKGSPLSDLVLINKKILSLHHNYDILKKAMLALNSMGVYIEAPNYTYLAVNSNNPDIPENCTFLNFAGTIEDNPRKIGNNLLKTEFFTSVGLISINLVARTLYPSDSDYFKNDGLVPLSSAVYYGNARVFEGYDHFDLAVAKEIILEAVSYFYGH